MKGDPGYFGPHSMMWKINKEITVLFGGARALLNACSTPLNCCRGSSNIFLSERSMEETNQNFISAKLSYLWTKQEADESAHRINKLHEVIKGKDSVSGGIYDALDHEQFCGFMHVYKFHQFIFMKKL